MDGEGFDRLISLSVCGSVHFSLKNAGGNATSTHLFIPVVKQLCSGLCTMVDSENTGDLSVSETPPTRVQIINRTLQETHLKATHWACVSE